MNKTTFIPEHESAENDENQRELDNMAEARPIVKPSLLADILRCLNSIPRTKVAGKFKDTYEICTAIEKELQNPLIMFSPDAAKTKWDAVEIQPIKEHEDKEHGKWCEPCEEGEEDFWSVYLHQVPDGIHGGVLCIADLPTYELAAGLSDLLKEAIKTYQPPAEPRVKSLYMVDIYYRTVAGNCASYRQVLEAFSSEEAMNTVTAKVEKKKRWFKTDGGDCIRM